MSARDEPLTPPTRRDSEAPAAPSDSTQASPALPTLSSNRGGPQPSNLKQADPSSSKPATEPSGISAAGPSSPRPADEQADSSASGAPSELEEAVIAAIQTCYDPEIPVNIYELGLIYKVDARPDGRVHVDMTLTSPACPVAGSLPGEVEQKIRAVPGVTDVHLELVWDPPWDMEMMSEAARLELGFM